MCFTSDDFLKETWQDYWQRSYMPLYVDFYDENTDEREIYAVQTLRYGRKIELIIENKEKIIEWSHNRQKLPSLVNVQNLIEVCKDYESNNNTVNIYYKIGMGGQLKEITHDFEKVNACSNIAEWHFIVVKYYAMIISI